MASAIQARLNDDIKTAMKSGQKDRLGALRMLAAALKQVEVDQRIELDDAAVLAILDKQAKQRRESIAQFEPAGRADLVAKENFELDLIKGYLPQPLSEAEIDALIAAAVTRTGAASIKDMGKVMAELKPAVQGRADMAAVSNRVKARLG